MNDLEAAITKAELAVHAIPEHVPINQQYLMLLELYYQIDIFGREI